MTTLGDVEMGGQFHREEQRRLGEEEKGTDRETELADNNRGGEEDLIQRG